MKKPEKKALDHLKPQDSVTALLLYIIELLEQLVKK